MKVESVFVHVTKACNLACSYCYFSAGTRDPDEMTAAEYKNLWPDLVALSVGKVVLTGGEPLLRPDALTLLADLRAADAEHRVTRCVNSNGAVITSEVARRLVGLADEIRISLDGPAGPNDAVRGNGSYRAAMRALGHLYSVGFEPKVLVTVTAAALPHVEQLIDDLMAANIRRINLNLFKPIGRGAAHEDWTVSHNDYLALAERLAAKWGLLVEGPSTRTAASRTNCGVGTVLAISPNGDVFPCHVLSLPGLRCGTVREESIRDILGPTRLRNSLTSASYVSLRSITGRSPENQGQACSGLRS